MTKADPAVLVTGASTGIGRACAQALADAGFHVFATVRKQVDADDLSAALGNRVTPLLMDVTDAETVAQAARAVAAALGDRTLAGVVNNAGIAVPGPLLHLTEDDLAHQLDVNVIGAVRVTQAFAPLLGVDDARQGAPGRIVMMSSVAGKVGSPFVGPYAASKHALEGLSESLRRELMLYGIDVIIVGPGAVATPIWSKAEELDLAPYQDTDYLEMLKTVRGYMIKNGETGLPPKTIADVVVRALTAAKPKTRYAVVPRPFMNWVLPRLLPKRMVDGIYAKRLGMKPKRAR